MITSLVVIKCDCCGSIELKETLDILQQKGWLAGVNQQPDWQNKDFCSDRCKRFFVSVDYNKG